MSQLHDNKKLTLLKRWLALKEKSILKTATDVELEELHSLGMIIGAKSQNKDNNSSYKVRSFKEEKC